MNLNVNDWLFGSIRYPIDAFIYKAMNILVSRKAGEFEEQMRDHQLPKKYLVKRGWFFFFL